MTKPDKDPRSVFVCTIKKKKTQAVFNETVKRHFEKLFLSKTTSELHLSSQMCSAAVWRTDRQRSPSLILFCQETRV